MPACFFCGKPRGEIVLFGKIGKGSVDKEAPKYFIMDYEPCNECKDKIADDIILIGVSKYKSCDGQPAISNNPTPLYPTGVWCTMKDESVQRIFEQTEEEMSKIKKFGKLLVDNSILQELIDNAR